MGKLIHYTSDAFTYVHNNCFTESLTAHREYENKLQEQFLRWVEEYRHYNKLQREDLNAFFRSAHECYLQKAANVQRECKYIMDMTYWLFGQLLPEASLAK